MIPIAPGFWRPKVNTSCTGSYLCVLFEAGEGSTTFTDSSPNNWAMSIGGGGGGNATTRLYTSGGGTAPDAAVKQGTCCGKFSNSNNSGVYSNNLSTISLGDNWTVEYWAYRTGASNNAWQGAVFNGRYNTHASSWVGGMQFGSRYYPGNPVGTGGFHRFYFGGTTGANEKYIDLTGTLPTNTAEHHAIVRNGTDGRVFINGTQTGSTINSLPSRTGVAYIDIGCFCISSSTDGLVSDSGESFDGYIDMVRVYNTTKYWASSFTPPTS